MMGIQEIQLREYQSPPEGTWQEWGIIGSRGSGKTTNVPGYETFTRESVRVDGNTLHIVGRARLCTVHVDVVVE